MDIVDWRTLPAADVARCYEAERTAWADRFNWDTTQNWRQIEAARAAGTLPGFLVYDGPGAAGWGFHLLHRRTLQIGGVSAVSAVAVEALIEGMLASPEAERAGDVLAFIPDSSGPTRDVLRARGFGVRTFAYLMQTPAAPVAVPFDGRPFHGGRLIATADLLSRAYPGADPSRPFAPRGTADEWLDYTTQLVSQTGCGELLPWASVSDEQPGQPGRLIGTVLATRIAHRTAHLAQVAVDVEWQGQGRGERLVREVLARLRERGYTNVSLLVADDNAAALRLYTRLGFSQRGSFLSAWRSITAAAA